MVYTKDELEDIRKRVKAVEEAVSALSKQGLVFLRIMADEMCTMYYSIYLFFQKGDEIDRYVKIWLKRLKEVRKEIENAQTLDGVARARDKFVEDIADYVKAAKVDTADKAMEIAHSFIKKYAPVALPLKAVREKDVWVVDIDVGALAVKIAKVKVDARTGDIISYDIPEKK